MDALLEQRWNSHASPFDGNCLHLDDLAPISQLRLLMASIIDILRSTNERSLLYRFEDWHSHDGFVTKPTSTDWDSIETILAPEDSLYAARHDDTDVYWSYYPDDLSFLFRFYVLDANDDPAYPGIWGDCDLCAPSSLIDSVLAASQRDLDKKLVVTNAKEYFDNCYAG